MGWRTGHLLTVAVGLCLASCIQAQAPGEQLLNQTGPGTWQVPTGVTSISVVCVGGGGGAGFYSESTYTGDGGGGGGGALAYKNNIAVTFGTTISYQIGKGGVGNNSPGGPSWFLSTTTVQAGGGQGGQGNSGGTGGTRVAGDGGGAGGRGGDQCYNTATSLDTGGAGGGAGGYSGNGGAGGCYPANGANAAAGSGAGGGGKDGRPTGGGGGGVGLNGRGADGLGATVASGGGGGGSGGDAGQSGGLGGKYGGGAGGVVGTTPSNRAGGDGGCRIVWPGTTRQFPATQVGASASPPSPPPATTPSPSPPPPTVVVSPSPPPPVVVSPSPPPPKTPSPSPPPPVVVSPSPPPPVVVSPSPPPPVVVAPSPPPPVVVAPSPPPPVVTPPPATTFRVDARLLVLVQSGFTNYDFLTTIALAYGVPHDLRVYSSAVAPDTYLYNLDGSYKYIAIMYPQSFDLSGTTMTAAHKTQIASYTQKSRARVVRFGADLKGFGAATTGGSMTGGTFVLNSAAPYLVSGLKPNIQLSGTGLSRAAANTPLTGTTCWDGATTNNACTGRSILDVSGTTTSAGVVAKFTDNREVMAFALSGCCAVGDACPPAQGQTCLLLSHLALSWAFRGVVPGLRRLLVSTQVDDLFLQSDTYKNPSLITRMTANDLNGAAAWQSSFVSGLPFGSSFKIEFAFNGNGIMEKAQDPATLYDTDANNLCLGYACQYNTPPSQYNSLRCNCWDIGFQACPASAPLFCRQCSYTWICPVGAGKKCIPSTYSATSWQPVTTWLGADALAAAASADMKKATPAFYYLSHTFTHQELNNVSNSDCNFQWGLNKEVANRLGALQGGGWSSKGCVTPGISGLFNPNNYKAMTDNGILAAVGDNTLPNFFLGKAPHPYRATISSAAFNGWDGFMIIPRWAQAVDYNVPSDSVLVTYYNQNYPTRVTTAAQVYALEADAWTQQALLPLRWDAFMFHQANVIGDGSSPLAKWVTAVVNKLLTWVTWPIETLKMDDLYAAFKDREARDNCQLTYTLNVDAASSVSSITVKSGGGACNAPLLLPNTVSVSGGNVAGNTAPYAVGTMNYRVPVAAGGTTTVAMVGVTY